MAATNGTITGNQLIEKSKNLSVSSRRGEQPDVNKLSPLEAKAVPASKRSTMPEKASENELSSSNSPPTVYGELSILGYNGYIPHGERNGRRNRSKFLLCKRPSPNGIKKSRHYIVKQPQHVTKAIQDKDLHSISYTFSRSQVIIVEYSQDETTDMFQIGRSSEDPIDFVIVDTVPTNIGSETSSHRHHHKTSHHHNHNNTQVAHQQSHSSRQNNARLSENSSLRQQLLSTNHELFRFHRHLAKVGQDLMHLAAPPLSQAQQGQERISSSSHRQHNQANAIATPTFLNYQPHDFANLPRHLIGDPYRGQNSAACLYYPPPHSHLQLSGHSSGQTSNHSIHQQGHNQQQQHHRLLSPTNLNEAVDLCHSSERHKNNELNIMNCKRSHTTQSTISRFACRIIVDRKHPFTARIYAAGFDASKNIFLGEKATKWEQNNSIDGLTTNGVLLMHPRRTQPIESSETERSNKQNIMSGDNQYLGRIESSKSDDSPSIKGNQHIETEFTKCDQSSQSGDIILRSDQSSVFGRELDISISKNSTNIITESGDPSKSSDSDKNNNNDDKNDNSSPFDQIQTKETGGVWREVSVDGGIYAIRETRSAAQKGTRIEDESNILQDGTLIDLCGATLLWRSVDGFRSAPTRKSLEEKVDSLNATRPQCPVGLNTLVIPRRPIIPTIHQQSHRGGHAQHSKDHSHRSSGPTKDSDDSEKSSQEPYVYIKCGHVQGYHDWGTTEKSNQRTCPICLSVGTVAKLSTGLEPSFYVDSGPLTHAFNPCGHAASEKTVQYWSSIKIPHGTHFFHSICPFCATPLTTSDTDKPYTRLIFQEDLD